MDFRPLHANELPALHGYVARNPFRLADNSLGFLLMWRPYAHTALAEAEGCLLLRTAYGGKIRFAWPIHPEADPEAELRALAAVEAWCVSNGVPLALASVPVERLPLLTRRYGRDMVIENPRTWRDYLYNLSDFVEMVYGLDSLKCINGGETGVTELLLGFGKLFGLKLKDKQCYNAYADIKRRKSDSRTYFFDKAAEKLNRRMQEDEERERMRKR